MRDLDPGDVIALLVVAGCFGLMAMGKNGPVLSILTIVVGYYCGEKAGRRRR